MGLEPVGAEAKRTLGRGLHRATGAPSAGGAWTCSNRVFATGSCQVEPIMPDRDGRAPEFTR